MTLTGCANIPAVDSRRYEIAHRSGERIVEMVREDLKPSAILTREALENAVRVDMAIGGSTNAIIHLKALSGRLGIDFPLERFDEISRETAVVANIRPSGTHLMEDMFYAGGIPVVMRDLLDQLHGDAMTVTGQTVRENVSSAECHNREVIRTRDRALQSEGGTIMLNGNLCPRGAVLKTSAASNELLQHTGRAVVFEDHGDFMRRVDMPDLDVDASSVLVLKNGGPIGAPGMPEYGNLSIPAKLLKQGVSDMVRISDARMSGTSYGTVVLHVAPESAVGGPLALVETGDLIRLDADGRKLDLLIDDAEFERREKAWKPRDAFYDRGFGRLYLESVLQADEGCDFSFLRGTGRAARKLPLAF
jgi:dihydroxy-acid dehydratase